MPKIVSVLVTSKFNFWVPLVVTTNKQEIERLSQGHCLFLYTASPKLLKFLGIAFHNSESKLVPFSSPRRGSI